MAVERNQALDVCGDGSVFIIDKKRESDQVSDVYGDESVFIVDKKRSESNKLSDVYGDGSGFVVNRKRNRNQGSDIHGDGSVFIVNKKRDIDLTNKTIQEEKKLDPRVPNFISLIFNVELMNPLVRQKLMSQLVLYNAINLGFGGLSNRTNNLALSSSTIYKEVTTKELSNGALGRMGVTTKAFLNGAPGRMGVTAKVLPNGALGLMGVTTQALPNGALGQMGATTKPSSNGALGRMGVATKSLPNDALGRIGVAPKSLPNIALGRMGATTKVLGDDTGSTQEDSLLNHYKSLCCELTPLEVDSAEFAMNTTPEIRSVFGYNTADIVHLFRVSRQGEDDRFSKFSSAKNRMLLWLGSPLPNWTGILSQGLRIPTEYGTGIYFADMFSKRKQYCGFNNFVAVLLLCEVALGDDMPPNPQSNNYCLTQHYGLPMGMLSTKLKGQIAPDPSQAHTMDDGVIVPLGMPKMHHERPLYHNEYVVNDVDQIRMRYVVQVKLNCA